MPYLTPVQTAPGESVRALSIPDNPYWTAIVAGALLELANPSNWEMSPGGITPYEAAEIGVEILLSLANEVPEVEQMTAVRVRSSSAFSLPNNALTPITFNSVNFDNGGYFDSAQPGWITIPEAGFYAITGQVVFAANATGVRRVMLTDYVGFSVYDYIQEAADTLATGLGQALRVMYIGQCHAGQTFAIRAYQNTGASMNLPALQYGPVLTAARHV